MSIDTMDHTTVTLLRAARRSIAGNELVRGKRSRARAEMKQDGSLGRKGFILIVEADHLIRELLDRWLSEARYDVVVGAREADVRTGTPSLVIANISNPQAAEELIGSLRARYAAPILAISARFRRGLGSSLSAAQDLGVCRVLPKPFTREELLAATRDAMEGIS